MNKSRVAAICLSALVVMWTIHFAANHIQQFGPIKGHTVPATEGPSALVRSLRPNYPYSVISGGVYSPRELQYAHSKDKVVRSHYADFNVEHAKLVTLTDDRFQYVSYRVKDQVYWTKKRLRIPKGELLLTDGVSYARARCGNRLSDKPHQAANSMHEPDSALLSLPPVNRDMLPKLALADPPAFGDISGVPSPGETRTGAVPPAEATPLPASPQPMIPLEPIWGGQPIVSGGIVPGTPPVPTGGSPSSPVSPISPSNPTTPVTPPNAPPPVSPVPEPSTIYLFLVSLVLSVWALLRMSPKDESDR